MKNFFKYIFITFALLLTFWGNVPEACAAEFINTPNEIVNIEQSKTTPTFKKVVHSEKYIISASVRDYSTIISCKRNYDNFNYGNSREKLISNSTQFSLLIAYLYNKTYLKIHLAENKQQLLATIKPNAP